MKKYYVYAYLREDRYSPYYIGKGHGRRLHEVCGRRVKAPTDATRRVKIKENLTEEEALATEKLLIAFWGREDTEGGVLLNMTDGGDGVSGWVPSEKWRQKRSILMKQTQQGKNNYAYKALKGGKKSEEHKENMSKAASGRRMVIGDDGKRHWQKV